MSETETSNIIGAERRPNTDVIFVNQNKHEVGTQRVSYSEITAFYLSDGGAASTEYLVKYSRGPAANPSGTLAPGNKVKIKDDMRFRISGTGES
ncbi:MAG: multiubiquitin domain-containing protein [Candidatus Devosia phytovorans]|uniref:Multiubiquitin domain-containing protein n=1 Tax=Candidatus Devosia phytovorans TaxID=3121372 RepID=A0AAJ6AZF0_9HYPH|nr:multiubiquitin domain-containing protein [Devosia sp.]WEK04057.1 MAG: multiubiquitin domain-containing protein [Devosia sp.]